MSARPFLPPSLASLPIVHPRCTLPMPCSTFPPLPTPTSAFLGRPYLPGTGPGISMVRTVHVPAPSSPTPESSQMYFTACLRHFWAGRGGFCWSKEHLGLCSNGPILSPSPLPMQLCQQGTCCILRSADRSGRLGEATCFLLTSLSFANRSPETCANSSPGASPRNQWDRETCKSWARIQHAPSLPEHAL